MACGGEMTDLTEGGDEDEEIMQHQPVSYTETTTMDLARHLGQVSLDSSPVLGPREPKVQKKFCLRELEIQQTIGNYGYISISLITLFSTELIQC